MQPVEINPSLGTVKEKFYGFEIRQIADVGMGALASLGVALLVPPELGVLKGMIASVVAVPFVLVALKDFFGLKGLMLARAAVRSAVNSGPLVFTTKYKNYKKFKKGR